MIIMGLASSLVFNLIGEGLYGSNVTCYGIVSLFIPLSVVATHKFVLFIGFF